MREKQLVGAMLLLRDYGAAACAQAWALEAMPRLPCPPHRLERYGASKLCNLLMTAELSRRLMQRGSSVTACTVSPGRVNTNIFQNIPGLLRRPVELLAGLVFQTPQQGARTVLRAAVAPELAGQHVLYMHAEKEAQPTAVARDPQLAADLWQRSVEAVGLTPEEDACLWPRQ